MAEKFNKKTLYSFIQEKYDIAKLPKHFFIKMASIFKGQLEGLNKPIPPEHMYDMWIRKSNYLDKVYIKNVSKGNKMEGYLRLNYDLAVIMSKYDDYLKWLDKQKALSVENEKLRENVSVECVSHMRNNEKNKNNIDDENISSFLDDLI